MHRRAFLQSVSAAVGLPLGSIEGGRQERPAAKREVMTVGGRIDAGDLGYTLTHEHVLVSFQPYRERVRSPLRYDRDEVVEVMLPHLTRVRELGCRTFVDATGVDVGRDVDVMTRLSRASGLQILTATGNYAARDNQFLPSYVFSDSAEGLAQRSIGEWENGIDGTDVRPGFIKLGFNGGRLSEVELKLIRAAALAHLATGLTIGAHTGPAVSAFEQLASLEAAGVHPSAWIWIHAQNEPDLSQQVAAARRGAWISFDGVGPSSVSAHVKMIERLRHEGLLQRVLVSHDAGWYRVGEPRGGRVRSYETVFTELIPALRAAGFTGSEIEMLFVANPSNAFSIEVRRRRDRTDILD